MRKGAHRGALFCAYSYKMVSIFDAMRPEGLEPIHKLHHTRLSQRRPEWGLVPVGPALSLRTVLRVQVTVMGTK